MQRNTLIIDKRKELSTKYKKLLDGKDNFVIVSRSINNALKEIQENEPDLIIISDSIEEDLSDFCKKIRVLTFNTRPIIVAMSKSAELSDRIKVLENGADDFLSEPINKDEFKMRIMAHLRREDEVNIDSNTNLPNQKYTFKMLKRTLAHEKPWAALLITIENFENYKEIYTEIASEKLIQTYCAIINSAMDENDYLGELRENEFLLITSPLKSEKIASFLTFAFDSIASKFYSSEDSKRGYTILQGDEQAGRRCDFVSTTIGVITNEFKKYTTTQEIMTKLIQTQNLAKLPSGSNFAIDRPQISGNNSVEAKDFNNKIWVLEEDDALSFLLATTLKLQGYEVEVLKNTQVIGSLTSVAEFAFNKTTPALIVIDAGSVEDNSGLSICKTLKNDKIFEKTKFIVTSIFHDKELVLNTGAELYLPKPYELSTLMKWVKFFINEYNNN